MKPRVLLVEALHPDAVTWLRERGEVIFAGDHREQALLRLVPEIDGITIRANGRIDEPCWRRPSGIRGIGGLLRS